MQSLTPTQFNSRRLQSLGLVTFVLHSDPHMTADITTGRAYNASQQAACESDTAASQ